MRQEGFLNEVAATLGFKTSKKYSGRQQTCVAVGRVVSSREHVWGIACRLGLLETKYKTKCPLGFPAEGIPV